MKLFLCAGCNRHVKDEGACPFCGETTGGPLVGDSSHVIPRMSRSALVIGASLGAVVTLAMTNCSSSAYGGPIRGDASFPEVHAADVHQEAEPSTDASADAELDAPDAGDAAAD